jgi:polyisoprenoid-binding protein YceI
MLSPRIHPLAAALAIAIGAAVAHGARADRVSGSIEISFVGSSTVHDFEGSAAPIHVTVESQPDGTWSGEVAVPVVTLDTGIDRRDENLRAMFDASHHPEIHGRFLGVDAEQVRQASVLPFTLRIRDVERPVQAKLSNWNQQDDRHARFDAAFDVSLQDFGLEAPSVLFMSVEDTVHVTVHVALERS